MGDELWDQDKVWRDKKGRPLEYGGGGAEWASEHPDAKEHCSLCLDRRPGLGRRGCSDLHVESAVESTGRRKPGGYSIEQQEPQRLPDWESWREQRARYLKALSFLRGVVSRKPTLGPSVQHRGPAALVC